MSRSFMVVGWCIALLLLAAARHGIAQVDPVAVQQHLLEALARGDIASALALFTDDAVIDAPSGPCLPPRVWVKPQSRRTWNVWWRTKVGV